MCFSSPTCGGGGSNFIMCRFSQNFSAPLLVIFTSSAVPGLGGGELMYLSAPAGRRADAGDSLESAKRPDGERRIRGSNADPGEMTRKGWRVLGQTEPDGRRDAGIVSATPLVLCVCGSTSDACSGPFFASPACVQGLATWSWLGYHRAATLDTAPPVTVDAVIYFEIFRSLGTANLLLVSAAFGIYTPNLAHPQDVIALYKGPGGDNGSCDAYRTLESCTEYSPLSTPPTLVLQLCWAYTSSLGPQGGDPTAAGSAALSAGSVNFCSGVTESGGSGAYYALLYSFNLNRIIAQVN